MSAHLFTPSRLVQGPAPARASALPTGKLKEAGSLVLVALAIYVALSLAGVREDPSDPSVLGTEWVGPVGGFLGAVLARGFGVVSWLAPVELVLFALPLLRPSRTRITSLHLAGDLCVLVIVSSLVHIAAPAAVAFGKLPAGGNVGLFFGELLQSLFSAIGSFLVGGTVVGLILIGRSQFSFIQLVERATLFSRWVETKVEALLARLGEAWGAARVLRKEREAAARDAAPPVPDAAAKDAEKDAAIVATLAAEDDEEWLPIEHTGPPPIALSAALREGDARRKIALGEDPAPPAVVLPVVRPITMPKKARKAKPVPPEAEVPAEPEDAPGEDPLEAEEAVAASPLVPEAPPVKARSEKKEGPAEPTIVDTRPEREVKRAARAPEKRRSGFQLPSTELLQAAPPTVNDVDKRRVFELSEKLERTLLDYGVTGKVVEIHPGPTVTTYEVAPEAGTKVSKIASLSDDLALGLSRKVRIVAPIPGKSRIGFELPNDERQPVNLRELVDDKRFDQLSEKAPLPVVLGRDIVGAPYYADLASMPHVIVAGATGAGKSVGLNVMLSSLLFRRTPDELRLLMIDPKVVELAPFDGIPHMLLPVVTDMKQAAKALKWAVDEMERRYQLFADAGTKNIGTYNRWVKRIEDGEIPPPARNEVDAITAEGAVVSVPSAKEGADGVALPGKLPYIVVVVDEFADLMMQQGKDVEAAIARLAQKARAAGMHVVLATQRPSVDVITGMIKANFPTRIAFRVAQKVDSRTILDEQGSELLLGKGDMLVKMNGSNEMKRVQCPFVSEEEVEALTSFLRTQGTPTYHDAILQRADDDEEPEGEEEPIDPRFDEAVRIVADTRRCSTSWLQRKMTIGYNRAAKIVEMMEKQGMVGPPNGARDREVLISPQ
ncbi:MAG TPA: DNA translocase FtsK 4TM domain-containing protein [Polyangiaceae bacterium]|nr:DNA translocase FtsK 4TM domain-containing protein [Polyangiaceae bacterium]